MRIMMRPDSGKTGLETSRGFKRVTLRVGT